MLVLVLVCRMAVVMAMVIDLLVTCGRIGVGGCFDGRN